MNNEIQNQQQKQKPAQGASSKAGQGVSRQILTVGTRVYSCLYGGRHGVVFAIHGNQVPESVQIMLDGVGVRGGNAHFDVVFEDGSMAIKLSEAIVRGIQWTIYDEQASIDEIAQLLKNAERKRVEGVLAKQQAERAFTTETGRLMNAPELKHLTQGDDVYSGKLAAANMRAALRKAFPKVKFSVRKRHYGSVSVSWTDGPTESTVEAIVNRHKGGYFDGMEDLYRHEKTPFVAVFGGADYVWTRRENSAEMIERAIAEVFERYAGNLAGMERPTAAAFQAGQLFNVEVPELYESLQTMIRTQLAVLQDGEASAPPAPVEAEDVAQAEAVPDVQDMVSPEQPPRAPNWYERKQAARRERFEDRAASLTDESNQTYARARQMASAIPFGQPILVGHYSEQRDRNYRNRIHNTYGKSFQLQDKAKHYADKAASVGTGGISSDDPDAIIKLQEEVERLESDHALMKNANKAIRTHKTRGAQIAALMALGFTEKLATKALKPDHCGRVGFPSYALSNNNANIRRVKQRIQELESRRALQDIEIEGNGFTYREDTEENRVMFVFPGKPDEQTRTLLKRHAFKWSPSRGAWVRQLNNAGRWAAQQVRKVLEG